MDDCSADIDWNAVNKSIKEKQMTSKFFMMLCLSFFLSGTDASISLLMFCGLDECPLLSSMVFSSVLSAFSPASLVLLNLNSSEWDEFSRWRVNSQSAFNIPSPPPGGDGRMELND